MAKSGSLIEVKVIERVNLSQRDNKNDYYYNFKTQFRG
jgi:hypothetical protein